MKTTFGAVKQFSEIIELVNKNFPRLSDKEKAQILKKCIKISADSDH
jgi:hypothetical protein